jgi:phage N-6-adenine-methyltransferase
MPQPRKHQDRAERQRAYRERKRNADSAISADSDVTFEALFQAVPVASSASTDEQYTPRWVIDSARQVLGGIDLDPASSEAAQTVVRARHFYTQADNGLVRPWAGRVWCNPPYSSPEPWVRRLIAHHRAGEVPAALLLLNIAGTPEWARLLWNGGYKVCIVAERIEFRRADGQKRKSKNMYDQFIWYFGKHQRRFTAVFGQYGAIR